MLDKKRAVAGAYFKLLTCSDAVISGNRQYRPLLW